MKMRPLHCFSCEAALNQLIIPTRAQEHIIERHYYPFTLYDEIAEERSLFFENSVSPESLFNTIITQLRSGLQANKKQGNHYIYYYTFDFKVGVFPNRQGGFCETDTVKFVCNYTECQECNRHWPREVVTVYPCYNPFS